MAKQYKLKYIYMQPEHAMPKILYLKDISEKSANHMICFIVGCCVYKSLGCDVMYTDSHVLSYSTQSSGGLGCLGADEVA